MRNFALPNPSQPSDQLAAILQALSGAPVAGPTIVATPSNPASTSYTYEVVANSNGVSAVGTVTTVTGPTTLSSSNSIALSWNQPQFSTPTIFDVYRTSGGATQGKIASGLKFAPGINPSFVDTGITGDGTTPPSFNTSGTLAIGVVQPPQQLAAAGAITQISGTIFITGAAAVAATLAAPIAGAPSAGGQDGATIRILCTTGHAHTVTTPANTIDGTHHVITFANAGDFEDLTALNGVWYHSAGTGTIS